MTYMGRRGLLAGAAGVAAAAMGAEAVAAAGPRAGRTEPSAEPGGRRRHRDGAPEFRGAWLATVENIDWPSRAGLSAAAQRSELIGYLDTAVRRRLNAVILQVRPTADAMWPSEYEPWSQWLTGTQGKDPGWDPLGTAVAEAHARGLELHAWFNPYRIANHTDPSRLAASHPAREYPEWTVEYGGRLYYNPGLPEVRAFVQEAMLDAVDRYPLDAVHWDDYFYPYPVSDEYFDDDDAYDEYGGAFASRGDWRRDNVNALVREMREGIARVRPGTRFGISPFGVWRTRDQDPLGSPNGPSLCSYDDLYADTRLWIEQGWLDYVVPQLYWHIGHPTVDYVTLATWWAETVRGSGADLYVGEALYRCDPESETAAWRKVDELSRHLTYAARYAEVRGHVYFSGKQVATDPLGAMARVVADHYPTAVPPR
ncbi:glycoside hydrolase family 10 protein [Streptomyces sp. NPDC093225]|uniref:glycoside hydrolase family 10 protein n=1 Tax=Streptomyces sp. NPDC093225 TaxID=3366034 RepID=UPI0037FFF82C